VVVSTSQLWFLRVRQAQNSGQNHIELVQHVAVSTAAFRDNVYIYADTLVTTDIKKAFSRGQAGPEYPRVESESESLFKVAVHQPFQVG